MKLRMSCLVTRPAWPVPATWPMSTPCSAAMRRTTGVERRRRRSSAVAGVEGRSAGAGEGSVAGAGFPAGAPARPAVAAASAASARAASPAGSPATSVDEAPPAGAGPALPGAPPPPPRPASPAGSPATSVDEAPPAAPSPAAPPAESITPTMVPTSTVSPSGTVISTSTPPVGDGISASTLSVEISRMGSSTSMRSPTAFSQRETVPSAIDSPIWGIGTSMRDTTDTPLLAAARSGFGARHRQYPGHRQYSTR